jgi:EpsI family protein
MAVAIVLAGAISWQLRWVEIIPATAPDFSKIPLFAGEWSGTLRDLSQEELVILRANRTYAATFSTPTSTAVELFIAYFTSQKYGSSIHSPRNCLPGSGWTIASIKKAPWIVNDRQFVLNKMTILRNDQKYIVYYWYLTRSGEIDSEMGLKFDLIKNSLMGKATDGVLIRVTAPLAPGFNDSPDVQEFLKIFSKDVYSSLPLQT